jgi:hypothetical protein
VDGEEDFEQLAVAGDDRVERDLHDLCVPRRAVADRAIGRVLDVPARVARHDALDAAQLLVDRLQTPETTAGERRQLPRLFSTHLDSRPLSEV